MLLVALFRLLRDDSSLFVVALFSTDHISLGRHSRNISPVEFFGLAAPPSGFVHGGAASGVQPVGLGRSCFVA